MRLAHLALLLVAGNMATLTHSKYSWWWDSHIPKNSKWLQENLNDMDSKVKSMIKLIEEDADSFARRAEMYYKKRPELMKLVEEFYRAYRALAERYDQSTGALRQAHRTMAEAFPNQIPFLLPDDSPSSSSLTETEPHTPEMTRPRRASLDPDDLHKDALGVSSSQFSASNRNGAYSDDSEHFIGRRGLKQLDELFGSGEGARHLAQFSEGKARKGLNFHEDDSHTLKSKVAEESLRAGKAESEVQNLTEALAKLEAEKEAGLLQYQQSLERLANVETEVSRAQADAKELDERARRAETELQSLQNTLAALKAEKDSGDLEYRLTLEKLSSLEIEFHRLQEGARESNERASKAEAEVLNLRQSLTVLETEKEASYLQYEQCVEKIANLESRISRAEGDADRLAEQGSKAETEVQSLKKAIEVLEAEKEACLFQYKQCMATISNLESKLANAESNAFTLNGRAEKVESDVQSLRNAISKLEDEKEAAGTRYQFCLVTISNLEGEIAEAHGEIKRLNHEVAMGVAKLRGSEEQYLLLEKENHSLKRKVESLVQETEIQRRELLEKQEELERLHKHLKEENIRVIQAEAAFQVLQNLHSQSQEAQKSLTMELQKGLLMLKDMEHWSKSLEEELQQVKDENKSLNDQNLASSMSISSLQEEIYRLKDMAGKLEEEVGLRLDQRNALQQEIYCLKEEINDLNRRHHGVIEQLESVGLKPDTLASSVTELQDEKSNLKEIYIKESNEKVILLQKLENMEKILEKNALLEISLSDLNAELEAVREKVKALEESCRSFQGETTALIADRASLISQLGIATVNMEKISGRNAMLENSVSDKNVELESLRAGSKNLRDSCQSLEKERSDLLTERESLVSHLKRFQQTLEELEKKYTELEEKCSVLEKEKEYTIHQVEELRAALNVEKQEHATFSQSSETRLARLEGQVSVLQEESYWRVKELEAEQERTIKSQVEIFILQKCIRDMEDKNFMLLIECEKHFAESKLSEKLISELEEDCHEQQLEAIFLLNQLQNLRLGIRDLLDSVNAHPDYMSQDKIEEDQVLLQNILEKIKGTESCLLQTQDEKQQMLFENLVLITLVGQMRLEASDVTSEKNMLDLELKRQLEKLRILQSEKQELLDMNGNLTLEAGVAEKQKGELKAELENLQVKLTSLEESYSVVQNENSKLCEGNRLLMVDFSALEEKNRILEEEKNLVLGEAIALGNLSLIFKSFSAEKTVELNGLREDMNHLQLVNNGFQKGISEMERKLEAVEKENSHLKESVEILEGELNATKDVNHQLNHQLGIGRETLIQKETELSEASKKFIAKQAENVELCGNVEELQKQCQEDRFTREDLEKQVLELSDDNTHQQKEIEFLKETAAKFVGQLDKLQKEIRDRDFREEKLSSELLETRSNDKLQEELSATLYGDLQHSAICAAVFRDKANELIGVCESLRDDSDSKGAAVEQLKERLDVLENENRGLKSNFAEYVPVVLYLRDTLISLEEHVLLRTKILVADNQDAGLASPHKEENSHEPHEAVQNLVISDGVSDLHGLQTRVKAVEEAVIEMERLALQENLIVNVKLEAAMKEIEKVKSGSMSIKEGVRPSKYIVMELEEEHGDKPCSPEQQEVEPEVSRVRSGIVMKDIPLDQVSECSSYGTGFGPRTMSRRGKGVSDDQMLKLWETSEKNSYNDHQRKKAEKVGPAPMEDDAKADHIEAVEEIKSEYPSSELHPEKELGVDKLEISHRFTDTHQGNRKKILERLTSDAQKLTNIQITIEDLKKKMETTNKSKKTKGIDYSTLKGQLQEVEEGIMQLVDTNIKLSTKVEGSPLVMEEKAAEEVEDTRKVRKRRVSEQARRGSEKIGRLQLEVQRIQFALLKLEEEHEVKGGSPDKRSTSVRLRDYLYISGRSGRKKKKGSCCACIKPPTTNET